MTTTDRERRWWDELSVDSDHGVRCSLGALTLILFRTGTEWQIGYERLDGPELDLRDDWSEESITDVPEEFPNLERFVAEDGRSSARFLPRVADRSVVARPRMPLHVLPGQTTKVYLSAPVWVELLVAGGSESLWEIPTRRLSNTWFGPSTREGEVAYALKTQARSRLEEVPQRSYRAITAVAIRNQASDVLLVDRVNLPIPYLSIYATPRGKLWTEAITLLREEGSSMAALDVSSGAPPEAVDARRLSEPRLIATESLVVRAFSTLLRPFGGEAAT